MRILITSYAAHPSVGGIETVTRLMATEFVNRGHEVKVVTHTKEVADSAEPYPTIRRPSPWQLLKLVSDADVVWQNGIALSYLWAPLLLRKAVAVTLAGAIFDGLPAKTIRQRIKAFTLRGCHVFAISPYVTSGLSLRADLVGNPFERPPVTTFQGVERNRDVVFVGRLVSDKGADMVIDALDRLKREGLNATCTLIGDGPERAALQATVARSGLDDCVRFTGFLRADALYQEIGRHRLMVVPSRWEEPFGVVALEGIACGCAVIGSAGGGLPMAIGPCGTTFPNNDLGGLVAALRQALGNRDWAASRIKHAGEHLARFEVTRQAEHYLKVFEALKEGRIPEPYPPFDGLQSN